MGKNTKDAGANMDRRELCESISRRARAGATFCCWYSVHRRRRPLHHMDHLGAHVALRTAHPSFTNMMHRERAAARGNCPALHRRRDTAARRVLFEARACCYLSMPCRDRGTHTHTQTLHRRACLQSTIQRPGSLPDAGVSMVRRQSERRMESGTADVGRGRRCGG